MAQWDSGEYSEEPEEVETLYHRYGNAWRKGDYVLRRFLVGSHAAIGGMGRVIKCHGLLYNAR